MITVPEKVLALLAGCRRRIRRVLLVRGIVETGATFLATVVAVMTVDAFFVIFSESVRHWMSAGIWSLTALVCVLTLWRRMRRVPSSRLLASVLDARHPEHEECLSTLVEIAERAKEGRSNLSPVLVSTLAARCSVAAGRLTPAREFTNRRVRWCLWSLLALFAALVAALVTMPNLAGRLFVRAVLPWVDVGNLYEDDLTVSPGDVVALVCTEIRIEATADASLHSSPWIRISRRSGQGWGEEFAEPLKDGVYTVIADLAEREWRYRISAGPAVSKFYSVRVCEMPRCRSFTAEVRYPAYTGKPTATVSNDELRAISAIEGTRVRFRPVPEREDTRCFFRIGTAPRLEHTMVSNRTDVWSLDLESAEGFRAPRQTGTLRSHKDRPPTVVVESPKERLLHLPGYSSFPVKLSAGDDVALKRVSICYSIDGRERQLLREVKVAGQGEGGLATFLKAEEEIDLSLIGDALTRNVEFVLVAEDGRGDDFGGPQAATSTPFTVSFEVRAENWELQDLGREMHEVEGLLREAQKRIDAAESPTREANSALKREDRVTDATEKRIEQAYHEAEEALERLEEIDDILKRDGRFEPVRELVEEQEARLKPILEQLEAAQFDEAETRQQALEEVLPEIREARDEMNALSKPLKERKEEVELYEQTRDLAVRQEALARAAEAIVAERPVDTKKLDVWREMEEAAVAAARKLERELGAAHGPDEARSKMEKAVQLMKELKREIQLDERAAKQQNVEDERQRLRRADESSRDSHLREAEKIARRVEDQLAKAQGQLANAAKLPPQVENALRAALGDEKSMAERVEFAEAAPEVDAAVKAAADMVKAAVDGFEKAKARAELDKKALKAAEGEAKRAEGKAKKAKGSEAALDAVKSARGQVEAMKAKLGENEAKAKASLSEQVAAAKAAQTALREQLAAENALRKEKAKGEGTRAKDEGPRAKGEGEGEEAKASEREQPGAKAEEAAEAMRETAKAKAEAMGIAPPEFGKEQDTPSSAEQPANTSGSGEKRDDSERPSAGGVLAEINAKVAELKLRDPERIKPLNIKAGWFRIRGAASGKLGDRELKGVPPEYRDLVRAYFLKLADPDQ